MPRTPVAAAAAALLAFSAAAQALSFNFSFVAGTSAQAQQAFVDAGARCSMLFIEPVTLNLTVGQQSLGSGILASADAAGALYSYGSFLSALGSDGSSADDLQALSALPNAASFGMLINRTADNPNGAGSATAYLDNNGSANNTSLRITSANAKAVGLVSPGAIVGVCTLACDASIVFATAYTWDFDPSDGISAGAYDFVGIAAHEIGHALGFISGVDVLDTNSSGSFFAADAFTDVNSLDLFRYSAASTAAGVIDWTASTTAKYFSRNQGVTAGAPFSTGRTWGDGQQASHWKDKLALGIMDLTAAQGELLNITPYDVQALDVICWSLATAVPEPATYALYGLGLLGITLRRRLGQRA